MAALQHSVRFCRTARWSSCAQSPLSKSAFSFRPPQRWAEFPALHSRSSFVICFVHSGVHMGFPSVSVGKESACSAGDAEDTHSSTLAWRIPWTEEPGRLQSPGSQSRTQQKQLSTRACTWRVSVSPGLQLIPPARPRLVSVSLFSVSVALFLLCK